MKLVTSLVTGAAVLAVGGGVFAAQAVASPTAPTPPPSATSTAADPATASGRARVIWFYTALTDAQRTCLADAGLQRPKGRLSDDQIARLKSDVQAALAKCGVQLPARLTERPRLGFAWAALTSEQQHCLAGQQLTRPVGRLTDAERAAVRQSKLDAAASCGVGR
jgi:mRNA-degrading endonuclease toxin of MazEF toxin-antitoxin module